MASFVRRHRKKLIALGVVVATPLMLHGYVGCVSRLEPPPITTPKLEVTETSSVGEIDAFPRPAPQSWAGALT